jgi:Protein of unknown function (DUF402)
VSWQAGDAIVRRDVWHGCPMVAWGGTVVQDAPDLLALYMPEGSPLRFAPDFFGAPHPWSYTDRWRGHGVLQLQRPGEMHSVWVFWEGEDRAFAGWYINLQEPFRRTPLGVDTQDLELDIVLPPDGSWRYKDDEQMERWVKRGRWTPAEMAAIRGEANRIGRQLESGRRWWQDEWMSWEPDPQWPQPTLPAAWDRL